MQTVMLLLAQSCISRLTTTKHPSTSPVWLEHYAVFTARSAVYLQGITGLNVHSDRFCYGGMLHMQDIDEKAEEAYKKMEDAFRVQLGLTTESIAVT